MLDFSVFQIVILESVFEDGVRFTCTLCGCNYRHKPNAYNHIKVKHTDRSFPCPHCSYNTGRKADLLRHIKRRHKGTDNASVVKKL